LAVLVHHADWRGKSPVSYQTIVQLIAATRTRTGLNVKCEIDPASYPAGLKVTDAEMAAIYITPPEFHGEWNYFRQGDWRAGIAHDTAHGVVGNAGDHPASRVVSADCRGFVLARTERE
jgi:hypothetical protein